MSIFSRFFYVLRANLNLFSAAGADPAEEFRDETTHTEGSRKTHSQKEYTDARQPGGEEQDRDPVLAEYYANLEVPYGSDLATVRRAWKELLKRYHPDIHSGDSEKQQIANELVKRLNHAYRELEKRLEE